MKSFFSSPTPERMSEVGFDLVCRIIAPSPPLPSSLSPAEPHNWSNSLPSFIVRATVTGKSTERPRPPDELIVALS